MSMLRGCEREARGIAAYTLEAAEETLMAGCLAQHAGREIEGDHPASRGSGA